MELYKMLNQNHKRQKTWKTVTGIKNEGNKQKTVTNIANIVG